MLIVNGRKIADDILRRLEKKTTPRKTFGILLIGDDQSSLEVIRMKIKIAKRLGIQTDFTRLPHTATFRTVQKTITKILSTKNNGGLLLQLPLPKGLDRAKVLALIPSDKDMDVIGEEGLKLFHQDKNPLAPPAVGTVQEILKKERFPLEKKTVAVVGLGLLVGRPIANWLKGRAKHLALYDAKRKFTSLKDADLVVSGVGHGGLIKPTYLKKGVGIIDFGNDFRSGHLRGDFDAELLETKPELKKRIGFYTPTPGGTGPIVIAKLFENFYKLNK